MTFTTFVLMYEEGYLKFGSYNKATLVDNPMKATLYSRLSDVKKRQESEIWINNIQQKQEPFIKELVFQLIDTREVE